MRSPRAWRRLVRLLPQLAGDGLAQLRAGWRSQALTLVGILWGAASVVLLLSLGSGFNDFLDMSFEKTGLRWTHVDNAYTSSERGGRRPGRRIRFDLDDLERLRAGVPSASLVAAEALSRVSVETPRRTRATVVSAASVELRNIQNHRASRGRYFDAEDERERRRVAVLGPNLAEIFFGEDDPIGRTLQVGGEPFELIGVLARKGWHLITFMDIFDNMVFLPLEVGLHALGGGKEVGHFFFEPRRLDDETALRSEVFAALAPFHHLAEDDEQALRLMSVPEVAGPTRNIFFALQVLLGVVGTVTLAMAGMGVANLMIAIANERRMELAVRRTCGARRADLILQLLVETLVVVLAGGAAGVAVGLGAVGALNALPLPEEFPPPQLLPSVVATTFGVLVGVGLAAGVVPARVAARVDPATALRVT